MRLIIIFSMFLSVFCTPIQATLVQKETIQGLKDVKSRLEELLKTRAASEILVLFDWDKVISKHDGENAQNDTFEFRDDKTLDIFQYLRENNVPTAILTARLHGFPAFTDSSLAFPIFMKNFKVKDIKEYNDIVNESNNSLEKFKLEMIDMNKELQLDNTAISPLKLEMQKKSIKFQLDNKNESFISTLGAIFFVGQDKAQALDAMLEMQAFKEDPKVIIFVDDKVENIEGMEELFGKKENITMYLFHYPVLR